MKTRFKSSSRTYSRQNWWNSAVEFYAKGIKELPDKWQQVIENNGEYIIDLGTIVIFLLKNKINI